VSETAATQPGADVAAPVSTGADLGGAFRTFEGGSELPATGATTDAADAPAASKAPVFTKDELTLVDAAPDETADADGDDAEDAGEVEAEEGDTDTGAEDAVDGSEEAEAAADGDAEAPNLSGVPDDPSEYVLPEVAGFDWNEAQRAAAMPYLESLHEQGASQGQVAAVMERYAVQMAAIETLNREAVPGVEAALVKEWGSKEALAANVATIKAYLDNPKNVSPDVARGIREARMPNGLKLANSPSFVKLLLSVAKGETVTQRQPSQATRSKGDAVSEEIVRLENLMADDIGAWHNKRWETSGVTASERYLDLMRLQAKTTEAPAVEVGGPEVASEEAELESLMNSDISAYQSRPWKNTGKTASDRAYELAKLRTKR
jgi:hypothetical protein